MPVERPVYAFYTRGSQCIKFPFLHFFGIARAMRVWHIGACRVLILVGCDRFSSFLGLLLSGAHNTGEIFLRQSLGCCISATIAHEQGSPWIDAAKDMFYA